MKKIITIIFIGLLSFEMSAQTEQGMKILGGSSTFNVTSITITEMDGEDVDIDNVTSEGELTVSAGYFVMDGLAIGLFLQSKVAMQEIEGFEDVETSSVTYGLMARYYLNRSFWGQVGLSMGSQEDTGGNETDLSSIDLGIGYAIYLNDNISVNPAIGYSMITTDSDVAEMKMSGLTLAAGITMHF